MTDQPKKPETLHKFPCDFTIKVFGLATDEFEVAVLTILNKHLPTILEGAIQSRESANNKYRALSITVHVESKEQLDRIYQDLSSSDQILMAL